MVAPDISDVVAREEQVEHLPRVRADVDGVTEKDDAVATLIVQLAQHRLQRGGIGVNVRDDPEFGRHTSVYSSTHRIRPSTDCLSPPFACACDEQARLVVEKPAWEAYFEGHAEVYDSASYTSRTSREVDFLLEELGVSPGASILDVCCGTGRHSVELAKRGYRVTDIDLAAGMLDRARAKAAATGVDVEFIRADATAFDLQRGYDGAICLCEAGIDCVAMGDDAVEQPLSVLRNIRSSLRAGARAMFTVASAIQHLRRVADSDVEAGEFDPVTMVESFAIAPQPGMPKVALRTRTFTPTDFSLLCRIAGLRVVAVWGGTTGNWGRRPLDLHEDEIMLVVERSRLNTSASRSKR